MNIVVLNGSPKGKNSITLQTVLYLQKRYPQYDMEIMHVGQRIRAYEKDFSEAKLLLEKADVVMLEYPVYTFLAPYQLHRFIELMKEHNVDLKGKFATQITTSKHFYDTTAQKYIEENCYDFGMRYVRGLFADMEDLLCEKGQIEAESFFEKMIFDVQNDIATTAPVGKTTKTKATYQKSISENANKITDKDVLIVTNVSDEDENLQNMIADFKATCKYKVREINIRKFPFKAGCLGCFNCSVSAKCVHKDGFDDYLRNDIQTADAIVYAFTIENHYTHSSFKCYDDRQFCNGHRSVTSGMPVGYIISGDYESEYNVQTLVEARSEVGGVYLCGVATDEKDTQKGIQSLSSSLEYVLLNKPVKPANFYAVGGAKIFRDLVYLMQGMMKADHLYYKKHGNYDFPQKKKGKIIGMKIIGSLMHMPSVQKKMKGQMSKYIAAPYVKLLEKTEAKK